ncbi:MAG: hypothetical protein ICV72_10710 [Aldersonia sp.]|nr:hypothetical protein [Aldersonia sp.]
MKVQHPHSVEFSLDAVDDGRGVVGTALSAIVIRAEYGIAVRSNFCSRRIEAARSASSL